jgi:hypothetical protein
LSSPINCPVREEIAVALLHRELARRVERVDATTLANAATAVAAAAYVICRLLALIVPDALWWVARTWFHGLALVPDGPAGYGQGVLDFTVGLVTFSVFVWLVVAATARLYNAWSRLS